jgi:hypothetical protein
MTNRIRPDSGVASAWHPAGLAGPRTEKAGKPKITQVVDFHDVFIYFSLRFEP